ncbi:MAG: class I SAM-dependent methyltransferase [Actinobacteria bacterium]|nr:class I SAM-dependent methyltransferase [Actinomycetota bacterium]
MPEMSRMERAACRSAPWRFVARRVVLPWALQGVRPAGRVLEIGAGSGAMAAELLTKFADVTVCATDFDEAMVATAKRRLAQFDGRVECRQADATALPFEDNSFDIVLSWIMLHHTLRWEDSLQEAVRVLRPGGRLVAYDLLGDPAVPFMRRTDHDGHRYIHFDELRAVLGDLPLEAVDIRRGKGGIVVRFNGVATG